MKSPAVSYKNELLRDLQDPRNCAEYLSFCLAESNETFLLGLKNVAEAQGGMTKLAASASVNRENLYKMLSGQGNPTLDSLMSVLIALGLNLEVTTAASTYEAARFARTHNPR